MKRLLLLVAVCLVVATGSLAQSKTVHRVSVSERADGKGYVVRLHTRGAVRQADIRVRQDDLSGAEISLRDAKQSSTVDFGATAGPIHAYTLDSSDEAVLLRLELDPTRPVQIVAYPDRDSDDALVALEYVNRDALPDSFRRSSRTEIAGSMETDGAVSDDEPETLAEVAEDAPQKIVGDVSNLVLATFSASDAARPAPSVNGSAWKLDCVVIDAGHGGKDPGAVANGVKEKDVNLAVAKKLGFYIEDRLGLRVVYTREDDRFISLRERGRIANDDCGKLFISIHVNSARRRAAKGTEVYFLGLHKTDAALEVMERENSVIKLEPDHEEYLDLTSDQAIMGTLAQSVYLHESELLADLVNRQFRDRARRASRGVKQAGFLVLWKASMPAILVELGFLTNKAEARYLSSRQGHDLLASAIFRAVRSYRDAYEKGFEWAAAE